MPRELRDEIYRYLFDGNEVYVNAIEDQACEPATGTTHQFDEEYIGKDMAREMAEYCYRTMHFRFRRDIDSIAPWLTKTDRNGLTRSELVKSIELYLDEEELADTFYINGSKAKAKTTSDELLKDLYAFRQAKKNTRVIIRLNPGSTQQYRNTDIDYYSSDDDVFDEDEFEENLWDSIFIKTLKLILPAIQKMKAFGLDIKVHVRSRDFKSTYEFTPTTQNFSLETFRKERLLVSSESGRPGNDVDGIYNILQLTGDPQKKTTKNRRE